MKRTGSIAAGLIALLLGSSCGSSTPSPAAASGSPTPSSTPTPTPAPPVFLYALKRHGGRPETLLSYRIEPESGRLTPLGRLEVRGALHLTGAPRGAWLHVDWCREYKTCQVASLRVASSGLPAIVAESETLPGVSMVALLASEHFVFVRWDDSSTGYSAGLAAYAVQPATGTFGPPVVFARRGGRYSTSRRLYRFALGHDASRVYTAESGGRLASYPVDEAGPGEKTGESGGHPDPPLQVLAHPRGGFVYVLSQTTSNDAREAAYVSVYNLDAEGAPAFRASVPVGHGPHSMVFDPDGRWLFVSGDSGIEAFSVDAQSGVPDLVRANRVERPRGFMAVEPQGRYLYLERDDDSGLTAFKTDLQTGALDEIGWQGPGDTGLVVVQARPFP